ncbi:hypothetical protein B0H19DRAFT_1077380 [Mycena capillaripes]|nr:hypothetical protein B0H19DRAFT_1077380 [Mycena capillaripes]
MKLEGSESFGRVNAGLGATLTPGADDDEMNNFVGLAWERKTETRGLRSIQRGRTPSRWGASMSASQRRGRRARTTTRFTIFLYLAWERQNETRGLRAVQARQCRPHSETQTPGASDDEIHDFSFISLGNAKMKFEDSEPFGRVNAAMLTSGGIFVLALLESRLRRISRRM